MIKYTTGNILDSETDAIVNTVNCEGYMGKGIAYQFKLKYPENNKEYVRQCKNGSFKIGSILDYKESGKVIINFPTKDMWRRKSEYIFIEKGLTTFIERISEFKASSFSFPPLGCGNGGLEWDKVKSILVDYLTPLQNDYDFVLYEPSNDISRVFNKKKIPNLNVSHLLLMKLKLGIEKFNKTRLQKGAFLINIFAGEEYFKFKAYNYGPYNHTLDVLSRDIKEYQEYYNFDTSKAYEAALKTLTSKSVNEKLEKFNKPLLNAINFLNDIKTDKELELISTILFIVLSNRNTSPENLPSEFEKWSEDKAKRFSVEEINNELEFLKNKGLLINSLMGVQINSTLPNILYK